MRRRFALRVSPACFLALNRSSSTRVLPPPPFSNLRSTPPPLRRAGKLPPPPSLPGVLLAPTNTFTPWKSPQDVLTAFIEFVPTFFVPLHCVAAILSEDCRNYFTGRGRLLSFVKRYRFFFELNIIDVIRCDIKLRDELSHPRRGVADEKFFIVDAGDTVNYVAKPEFIVSCESIEQSNASVPLRPACAPPAVHVRLEERVPVLERLKALVPVELAPLDHVEESVPEDILFHPYFDCQGGLAAIATKFPEFFQIVDGMIRRRPPELAPLALNDYTLEDSPIPSVAKLIQEQVCGGDIPQWVSVTSLYEQLTKEHKRQIKREFKSFAGFLRAHGRALSISTDMLRVSRWIPQQRKPKLSEAAESSSQRSKATASSDGDGNDTSGIQYEYTHTQIINELFDRFPRNRTLNMVEFLDLVPAKMRLSLPKKTLGWIASHPSYFSVDDPTEKDQQKVRIRRASDHQPLDVALILYQYIPEEGIADAELLSKLSSVHREYVECIGLQNIVNSLSDWLSFTEVCDAENGVKRGMLRRLRSEVEVERAICAKELRLGKDDSKEEMMESVKANIERRWPKLKYEGSISKHPQ